MVFSPICQWHVAIAIAECFKTMYNLNYTGAAQVWDMYKNNPKGLSDEQIAAEIKKLQTNPNYISDSEKLTNIYNKLNDISVNIGAHKINIEYDVLNEAMKLLVDKLKGIPTAERISEARNYVENTYNTPQMLERLYSVIDPYSLGDAAVLNFRDSLKELIDDATSNKSNEKIIGEMFIHEIVPLLPENPSDEIIKFLYDLADMYETFAGGSKSISDDEYHVIYGFMYDLRTMLRSLNGTLEDIQSNGIRGDVNIQEY